MKSSGAIKERPRFFVIVVLLLGVLVVNELLVRAGTVQGVAFMLLPVFALLGFAFALRPHATLWLYIAVNYYILGLTRYVDLKGGMLMMGFSVLLLVVLFVSQWLGKVEWRRGFNQLTLYWTIWFVYCTVLAFLPSAHFDAWMIAINLYAFIPLLLVFAVPIIFRRYRDLKIFLFVFSLLTLTAVCKALWQKTVGFDTAEKIFLYQEGGASTHIIWSGTRYFSFFTDAANFGSGMVFSMVVFSIASVYVRGWLRFYYLAVAVAAAYGFGLSGTRSAVIVPFVGYALYILTTKNKRILLAGVVTLAILFGFFKFTHIGDGNVMIYRIRSAFNPTEDASFQVRLENQERLRRVMADKPFGVGLGLGGGKASRFDDTAVTSWIATDSWYVMVWVETGAVGAVLYLVLNALILGVGAWRIMFRIRDPQLKGLLGALLAGAGGMMAGCYANEIMNFPNGPMVYICEAFVFAGCWYDRELAARKQKELSHGDEA